MLPAPFMIYDRSRTYLFSVVHVPLKLHESFVICLLEIHGTVKISSQLLLLAVLKLVHFQGK